MRGGSRAGVDEWRRGLFHPEWLLWCGSGGWGGRKAFTLRERELVACDLCGVWRAAAGLFFLVDNLMQISVLEHDVLTGLNPVESGVKEAGNDDVRGVYTWVIDAGIATGAEADLDFGCAGAAHKDSKIGSEQKVSGMGSGEAHLDSACIHSHQQAWRVAGGGVGVSSQLDGSGGADAQGSAARQGNFCSAGAGCDASAGDDDGLASRDLERARDAGTAFRIVERNDSNWSAGCHLLGCGRSLLSGCGGCYEDSDQGRVSNQQKNS